MSWFGSRSNNSTSQNQNQNQHKKQKQKRIFASREKQIQKTVEIQAFTNSINSVFKTINNVLNMVSNPSRFNNGTIDMMTDMLICSVDLFASCCYDFHQERNRDALDLGKKIVYDKFEELKNKNYNTYTQMECYREFLMAALKSKTLLTFNKDRILTNQQQKITEEATSNPEAINKAFAKLIGNKNINERRFDSYREKETNKQLQSNQEKQLAEFRKNNKKYAELDNDYSGDIADINQLYFTKSGKNSQFMDNDNGTDAVMADLMGDDGKEEYEWVNGVIKLNQFNSIVINIKNKAVTIFEPYPCQILISGEASKQPKVRVKLARPNRTQKDLWFDPNQYKIIYLQNNGKNKTYIANIEQMHCNKYQIDLGYDALFEYKPDLDNYDLNDLNDVNNGMGSLQINNCNPNVQNKLNNNVQIDCNNAVIKFNAKKQAYDITKPYPCLIIERDNHRNKLKVRLAKPNKLMTITASAKLIEYIDIDYIKRIETAHIKQYGDLGYESIKQLESKQRNTPNHIDFDEYDEGDDDSGMQY